MAQLPSTETSLNPHKTNGSAHDEYHQRQKAAPMGLGSSWNPVVHALGHLSLCPEPRSGVEPIFPLEQ